MEKSFDWAVIGAGPAGIAVVGQLIDKGITPSKILWIDPKFAVGDFGLYWNQVSSNTIVKLFNDYLNHLNAFEYNDRPGFTLDKLPPDETCKLGIMAKPLQWVTDRLLNKVTGLKAHVDKLCLTKRKWQLQLNNNEILKAKNVVIATGAKPRTMEAPDNVETISLYDALDPHKLAKKCSTNDTVAVFGASHSAIIILQALLDLNVKHVINFYTSPLKFALNVNGNILFDNTGLKGNAAIWAQENINGILPHNLTRIYSSKDNVATYLPQCSKVIHAIGFDRRAPIIDGFPEWNYNQATGVVAPGLFAVGIGFPESKIDIFGNTELRVGLWKFMEYFDRAIPLWLQYST